MLPLQVVQLEQIGIGFAQLLVLVQTLLIVRNRLIDFLGLKIARTDLVEDADALGFVLGRIQRALELFGFGKQRLAVDRRFRLRRFFFDRFFLSKKQHSIASVMSCQRIWIKTYP